MTYEELTRAATRLPPSQRLALIETLTRSLRRELTAADQASTEGLKPTLQVDITQVTIPQASDQPTEDPWDVMDRIGKQLSANAQPKSGIEASARTIHTSANSEAWDRLFQVMDEISELPHTGPLSPMEDLTQGRR